MGGTDHAWYAQVNGAPTGPHWFVCSIHRIHRPLCLMVRIEEPELL